MKNNKEYSIRSSVYDYTTYGGITMPNRDKSYFNRNEMIKPFDNISDKVALIINTLKTYWNNPAHSNIWSCVRQESLLGQAVCILAEKNATFDGFELKFNIDEKEIPIVFGDLMRVYSAAGYDVSLLKEFLVELYKEYYPKKYVARISRQSLEEDIENTMFKFLESLIKNIQNDDILRILKMNKPDFARLMREISISKDLWLEGIEVDERSQFEEVTILSPRIGLKINQKNTEVLEAFQKQIEAVIYKTIGEFPSFEVDHRILYRDTEDDAESLMCYLNQSKHLSIKIKITHDCTISNKESGGTSTGSIIQLDYNLMPQEE